MLIRSLNMPSSATETTQTQATTIPPTAGLTLQVDFVWSKFRNIVSSKSPDGTIIPLYIQHFRPTKPQLRFESAISKTNIAKDTIHSFSISADCILHGREIILKPLKRWKTQYNYLSRALRGSGEAVPVSWIANSSLKVWDFVCVNSVTQEPIAKFGVNLWALRQVGNFYFEKSESEIEEGLRDEVVVMGLTILYVMMTRINNPLHLLGSAFSKPGKVEGNEGTGGVNWVEREVDDKIKRP
jgi:hypothetical protein